MGSYQVFISHVGKHKNGFALPLRDMFESIDISAFVNETGLAIGGRAPRAMEKALTEAEVTVFLLDNDAYLRSLFCMALQRRQTILIHPVFLSRLENYPTTIAELKEIVGETVASRQGEQIFEYHQ